MGAPSPRYTAEFKQEAVELYKKSGTTYAEVAHGLGCDVGGLSDWVKKADAADCGRAAARSRWPRACAGSAPTAPTWRGSPTSPA